MQSQTNLKPFKKNEIVGVYLPGLSRYLGRVPVGTYRSLPRKDLVTSLEMGFPDELSAEGYRFWSARFSRLRRRGWYLSLGKEIPKAKGAQPQKEKTRDDRCLGNGCGEEEVFSLFVDA